MFEKLISEVGCQPYWLSELKTEFPSCSMAYQLKEFLDKLGDVGMLNEKKFHDRFKCYKPCKYYEYKVRNEQDIFIILGSDSPSENAQRASLTTTTTP